eukprot:scaffold315772_cov19-Prasinocladus_malaysianus.AAC.1
MRTKATATALSTEAMLALSDGHLNVGCLHESFMESRIDWIGDWHSMRVALFYTVHHPPAT